MLKFILYSFTLMGLVISLINPSLYAEKIPTKVIVRVVARDAQVIGSGVGGAFVRIKNFETGEVLAEGKQEGGAGNTDRIMVQPHRRGETIYGTSGSAFSNQRSPWIGQLRLRYMRRLLLPIPILSRKVQRPLPSSLEKIS